MKYSIPKHPTRPFYQLSESTTIGRGDKRDCHAHPDNPGLCIKVARHADRWHECQQQSIVEWHYLMHLKRRKVPLEHLPDCHGWVQTNYGSGLVLERIRNEDSSVALTLYDALANKHVEIKQAYSQLQALKYWAIINSVVVADLHAANIMVRKRNGNDQFVFVDGIGSRRPNWKFTLYQHSSLLSRLKTQRQWKRQIKQLTLAIDYFKKF